MFDTDTKFNLLLGELGVLEYKQLFEHNLGSPKRHFHNKAKLVNMMESIEKKEIYGEERKILLYTTLYIFLFWRPDIKYNYRTNINILNSHIYAQGLNKILTKDHIDIITNIMETVTDNKEYVTDIDKTFLEIYSCSCIRNPEDSDLKKMFEEENLIRKELSYIPWELYKKMRLTWLSKFRGIYKGCDMLYKHIEDKERPKTILYLTEVIPTANTISMINISGSFYERGLLVIKESKEERLNLIKKIKDEHGYNIMIYHKNNKELKDKSIIIYD